MRLSFYVTLLSLARLWRVSPLLGLWSIEAKESKQTAYQSVNLLTYQPLNNPQLMRPFPRIRIDNPRIIDPVDPHLTGSMNDLRFIQ